MESPHPQTGDLNWVEEWLQEQKSLPPAIAKLLKKQVKQSKDLAKFKEKIAKRISQTEGLQEKIRRKTQKYVLRSFMP